jgi:hypothetical protein
LPEAHDAKVLDPACGAGVFLVLAFRHLYKERWKKSPGGERPDTTAIREILNKQLTGFDISDSALKLAALSLYLTAVELDPAPSPPVKLKFARLRDRVLFNFRRERVDPETGAVAGSLGEHVGHRFDGRFDLVVGNPPWTSLKGKERQLAEQFNHLSKAIITRRAGEKNTEISGQYENPDSGPDLPFVWKSTEWCRTGGRIAMALPARILLKQEDIPRFARETLFRLVDVTGIINGANLWKTKIWSDVDQPFILFFAKNQKPKVTHSLNFITPYPDINLNGIGEIRIDPRSLRSVESGLAVEKPWLWKTFSIGTSLDLEVINRIQSAKGIALHKYWAGDYATSQGYQIANGQEAATALQILPDLHSPNPESSANDAPRFFIVAERFLKFSRSKLHRTRLQKKGDPLRVFWS